MASCQKEYIEKKDNVVQKKTIVGTRGTVVYSSTFDWENVNQITTGSGVILGMPWNTGINSFIPSAMKHNHPKSDGWEMLYNTLDLNQQDVPVMFALYNKYSGILHMFYQDIYSLETAEAYYEAYSINGSSSLLNFECGNNKSVNEKDYLPTIVKGPEGTINPSGNNQIIYVPTKGFVRGAWYGTEIEFSYEDVSSLSDNDFYLKYIPFRGKASSITMSGSMIGSITGTIEAKTAGNTNLIGSIGNIFTSSSNQTNVDVSKSNVTGTIIDNVSKAKTDATPKFWTGLWAKIQKDIPTAAQSAITSTLTSAINQGIKWATNPLNAFVSSVFSIGSSQGVPLNKVDLKIDTRINMSGSISSYVPNAMVDLALPNTQPARGGNGYPTLAMKDWNLGVWNIGNLPTVNYTIVNTLYKINGLVVMEPRTGGLDITIPNASSAVININPKVLQDCNVIQQKVDYIIQTSGQTNMNDFDDYNLEPFSFNKDNNTTTQSYYFPVLDGVGIFRDYHILGNEGCVVYARATLVLKNKTTGLEYVHIKDFKLKGKITKTTRYESL